MVMRCVDLVIMLSCEDLGIGSVVPCLPCKIACGATFSSTTTLIDGSVSNVNSFREKREKETLTSQGRNALERDGIAVGRAVGRSSLFRSFSGSLEIISFILTDRATPHLPDNRT